MFGTTCLRGEASIMVDRVQVFIQLSKPHLGLFSRRHLLPATGLPAPDQSMRLNLALGNFNKDSFFNENSHKRPKANISKWQNHFLSSNEFQKDLMATLANDSFVNDVFLLV